jgi:hypothetical protein
LAFLVKGGMQGSFGPMTMGLANTLTKQGINQTLHPRAYAAAIHFFQAADKPQQTLEQVETLRKVLGSAARSVDKDERRLAAIMIGRLDDYMDDLKPSDVVSGDPRRAATLIKRPQALPPNEQVGAD